ncbi:dihydroneopterin aldolase [Aquamicrobium sp. LC103]|uniref:amino acid kinase family protein n=1 Tax=Aquamicrobium sp. LC103 TaxID=1120658 RepID=UPI00063E7B1D|nr:dihydroneopterin aldolase [Aquamicrobium sp. LC103]TKT69362.1 dihydroneopterin aldolase [Aquamicrobium sp. LC103]
MRRAVVKLGGSIAGSEAMDNWIAAITAASFPIVIVPGGGPYADVVRETQKAMGFSDGAAHAMAILAMEQFGHVLCDRDERFVAARTLSDIENAPAPEAVPVWFPSETVLPAAEIPMSWDVTSDSLAAWLTSKIGADSLLLVKQSDAFSQADDVGALVARGLVDPAFPTMLPAEVDLRIAGPRHLAGAGALFRSGLLPGEPITRTGQARKAG